jgi:hypothetical protein
LYEILDRCKPENTIALSAERDEISPHQPEIKPRDHPVVWALCDHISRSPEMETLRKNEFVSVGV